jgi:hypothetical protein
VSADGPLPSAVERLAMSRERLRGAMRERSPAGGASGKRGPGELPDWLERVATAVPGAGVIIDAIQAWWNQHPMRVAGMVALDASKTLLRPLIQRNPVGLVLGAVVVGGLIAWAKPWRGVLKPALFAGLLPQLISKALANVPTESWMAVLTALAQQPERTKPPAEKAEAGPGEQAAAPTQPVPPTSNSVH